MLNVRFFGQQSRHLAMPIWSSRELFGVGTRDLGAGGCIPGFGRSGTGEDVEPPEQ